MPGALLALFLVSFLPEVENPWPDRIGIESILFLAGLGGAGGGLLTTWSSPERRDRCTRIGVFVGAAVGAAVYLISLGNQLLSDL